MLKLSDQIYKLTEVIDQISLENRKHTSELVISKNVNLRLEERIINLEKGRKGSSIAEEIIYSYQAYQPASAMKIWRIPLLTSPRSLE